MTNEEAIKYLIAPFATSTKSYNEYLKQKEAYELAIKALERPQGERKTCDQCMYLLYRHTDYPCIRCIRNNALVDEVRERQNDRFVTKRGEKDEKRNT